MHQATAAEVFGVEPAAVTPDQRRAAKAINFGLIYGMSAFGLARQLGIERGAAQKYVDLYFERYPGVKRYMDDTRAMAREQGFVETVFGRRLYLPDIRSRNAAAAPVRRAQRHQRADAGHGGGHHQAGHDRGAPLAAGERYRRRLVMQVHDELVLEVPEDAAGDRRARTARADDRGGGPAGAAQGGRRPGRGTGTSRTSPLVSGMRNVFA
ncbi:MAG: DNA polymerase [Chromatiales bacterium]|nr:DNA polymerase [Chromatiales bacterium]